MQRSRIMKRGGFRLVALLLTLVMLIGAIPAEAKAKKSLDRVEVGSKKKVYAEMRKAAAEVIVFATDKEVSYTFSKKYNETSRSKKLVIDAPNATIVNKAKFQAVTIINVKSYAEAGDENILYVKDSDAKIVVAKDANVKKIAVDAQSANIELRDNSNVGKLVFREKNTKATVRVGENSEADIALSKKTDITVKGSKNSDIDIYTKANNSKITTEIPVDITADADVKVTLEEGSEGTVIGTDSDDASVKIVNNSTETPTIKKGEEVISTPAPVSNPTPVPSASGESTSGENTETPKYTWIFTGSSSGDGTGSGSSGTGSGNGSGTSSSSNGANYTISTITAAPEPTVAPEIRGAWYAYGSKDQQARFDIEEYDNKGRLVKEGEIFTGYDMGEVAYYFYDKKGRVIKELYSDGSYEEYVYDDETSLLLKETYRDIDDNIERVETTAYDDNGNMKVTVTDGKDNVICYYNYTFSEDGSSEEVYVDTKGNELPVWRTKGIGNNILITLSADVNEKKGYYINLEEYTYDDSLRKTSYKRSAYNNGNLAYIDYIEYAYYDDGSIRKTTNKDTKGNITSSRSYEYYTNGDIAKLIKCGRNDVMEEYEVYSYEKIDENSHTKTVEYFDKDNQLTEYTVTKWVGDDYIETWYDENRNKTGCEIYELSDDGRTVTDTFKNADDETILIETTTLDEAGRIVKYEWKHLGELVESFSCVYNDDEHSFSATYFEDGSTAKLEASYDLATDTMTVVYQDGENAARNIIKKFSKTGMQMLVETDGEVSFERDTKNKNKIIKETFSRSRWDDDKQEHVEYEVVRIYIYDEVTGRLRHVEEKEGDTVIETTDYTYDTDGHLVEEKTTANSDNSYYTETVYTFYCSEDDDGSPVMKSKYLKDYSGNTYFYEYNEDGNVTLYESCDKAGKLFEKETYTYEGNVRTSLIYDTEDKPSEILEMTYADGHAYDDEYVVKALIKDLSNKPIMEATFNKFGMITDMKDYKDGQLCEETIYEYDKHDQVCRQIFLIYENGQIVSKTTHEYEDGKNIGYTEEEDGITSEYKYFDGVEDAILVKATRVDDNGETVIIEENQCKDYDGIFTVINDKDGTLSLTQAIISANTTKEYGYKYDVTYCFDGVEAASASAIEFSIQKDGDKITSIDSTRDGNIVGFLNIKYEYTDGINTRTIVRRYGDDGVNEDVYEFDEYGNLTDGDDDGLE